ncbi:MAG: CDP-alcohol phosphatidyltransferase family protein [Mycobacteriales bacterium]
MKAFEALEATDGLPSAPAVPDRVLTVPNLISFARLAAIAPFVWLVVGPRADGWAFAILVAAGASDWLDGVIARRFNMSSRLGALLDPLADRLYIAATLATLAYRGIIPLWLVAAVVARDLMLATTLPLLHRHGYGPLPVHFVGKTATLLLLYAFPLLLLSAGTDTVALVVKPIGWAFALWGTALYWWAGVLYFAQVRQLLGHGGGGEAG